MNDDRLKQAKSRLPLPELLAKIGDSPHAKKSAKCPFHEDRNNSFSVFQANDGGWLWKCFTGCGCGDGVTYLKKRFQISVADAINRYCREAGVANERRERRGVKSTSFNWLDCVAALTPDVLQELSAWRGLSLDFVNWLHQEGLIGLFDGNLAFPVHDKSGIATSCHMLVDRSKKKWVYKPTGNKTHPMVFGDPKQASDVWVFESQWDAFVVMDRLGWHLDKGLPRTAVIITRGSENGKLITGRCASDSTIYAFVQNDEEKNGRIPSEGWLHEVGANAGCAVMRVKTPEIYKDPNDWTRAGAGKEAIEAAMQSAEGVRATTPDQPTISSSADVRGRILEILRDRSLTAPQARAAIAQCVVSALMARGNFFFHQERQDFKSAMYFDRHRKKLELIRSDVFVAWLSEWTCVNRADRLFGAIAAAVETAALSGETTTGIVPEYFWASGADAIYLSNGDGQTVKITATGVNQVHNGTDGVLFAAGRTLAPWKLTNPADPFETCGLFANASCTAHGRQLIRLWIYSLPTNPRSKPPLCLAGEIGSGKTKLFEGIAALYGIPSIPTKLEDVGESDFWVNVDRGGLFCLDNADTSCRWLPDALASAATGGGKSPRKLYTDNETVVLRARAWTVVTSANPTFASDAGLADRLLPVRMKRRDGETSDSVLTQEIMEHRDAALSHIAYTLQRALADNTPTPPGLNERHPDFGAFAVKIGRALACEANAIAALRAAEADKAEFCVENSPIGGALMAVLKSGEFQGTAAELLPKLIAVDPDLSRNLSAKGLGKRLSGLWPHLEKVLVAERSPDRKGFTQFSLRLRTNISAK